MTGYKRALRYENRAKERKTIDIDLQDNAIQLPASNAYIIPLNEVQVGDQLFNRQGLQTVPSYLKMNAKFRPNFTTDYPTNEVVFPVWNEIRLILFYDKQPNNILFNKVSSLLQDVDANGTALPTTQTSAYNRSASDRFVVLLDDFFTLVVPDGSFPSIDPMTAQVDWYNKHTVNRLPTKFLDTLTDPQNTPVTSGAFYLLYYPQIENPVETSGGTAISGSARYAFTEGKLW